DARIPACRSSRPDRRAIERDDLGSIGLPEVSEPHIVNRLDAVVDDANRLGWCRLIFRGEYSDAVSDRRTAGLFDALPGQNATATRAVDGQRPIENDGQRIPP